MAGSPRFKIYDKSGKYQAACHEIAAAAALVSFYGNGATIRANHSPAWTLWTEGAETQSAAESYDFVDALCYRREYEMNRASYKKAYGCWPEERNADKPPFHGEKAAL